MLQWYFISMGEISKCCSEYVGDLLNHKSLTDRSACVVKKATFIVDKFPTKDTQALFLANENTFIIKDNSVSSISIDNSYITFGTKTMKITSPSSGSITSIDIDIQQSTNNDFIISCSQGNKYPISVKASHATNQILLKIVVATSNSILVLNDGNWNAIIEGGSYVTYKPLLLNHIIAFKDDATISAIEFGQNSNSSISSETGSLSILSLTIGPNSVLTFIDSCTVEKVQFKGNSIINGPITINQIKPPITGGVLTLPDATFPDTIRYQLEPDSSLKSLNPSTLIGIPTNLNFQLEFSPITSSVGSDGYKIPYLPNDVLGLNKMFLKTGSSLPKFTLYHFPENIIGFNDVIEMVKITKTQSGDYSFAFDSSIPSASELIKNICMYSSSATCPSGTTHKTDWESECSYVTKVLTLYIDKNSNLDFTTGINEGLTLTVVGKSSLSCSFKFSGSTKRVELQNIDATVQSGSLKCPVILKSSSLRGTADTSADSSLTTDSEKAVSIKFKKIDIQLATTETVSKISFLNIDTMKIEKSNNVILEYQYLVDAEIILHLSTSQTIISMLKETNALQPKALNLLNTGIITEYYLDGLTSPFWTMDLKSTSEVRVELKNKAVIPFSFEKMSTLTLTLSDVYESPLYIPLIDLTSSKTLNVNGNGDALIIFGEGTFSIDKIDIKINTQTLTKPIIFKKITVQNNVKNINITSDVSIQINNMIFDSSNGDQINRCTWIETEDYEKNFYCGICLTGSASCPSVDDTLVYEHDASKKRLITYINYATTTTQTRIYFYTQNLAVKQLRFGTCKNLTLTNAKSDLYGNIAFPVELINSTLDSKTQGNALIDYTIKIDGRSGTTAIFKNISYIPKTDISWMIFQPGRVGFEQLNGDIYYVSYSGSDTTINLSQNTYLSKCPMKYENGHPKQFKLETTYGYQIYNVITKPLFLYGFHENDFDWLFFYYKPPPGYSNFVGINIGVGGGGTHFFTLDYLKYIDYYILDENTTISWDGIGSACYAPDYKLTKFINFYGSENCRIKIKNLTIAGVTLLSINFNQKGIRIPIEVENLVIDFRGPNGFKNSYILNPNGGLNIKRLIFLQDASRPYTLIVKGNETYENPWTVGFCMTKDINECKERGDFAFDYINDNENPKKFMVQFYWTSSFTAYNPIINVQAKVAEIQEIWMDECYNLEVNNSILDLQGNFTFLKGPVYLQNSGLIGNPKIDKTIKIISDGLQSCEIGFTDMQINLPYEVEYFSFIDNNMILVHPTNYKEVKFGYTTLTNMKMTFLGTQKTQFTIMERSSTNIDYPLSFDLGLTSTMPDILYDGIRKNTKFLVQKYNVKQALNLRIANNSRIPFDISPWHTYLINFVGDDNTGFEIDRIDANDEYTDSTFVKESKQFTFVNGNKVQVKVVTINLTKEKSSAKTFSVIFKGCSQMYPMLVGTVFLYGNPVNPKIQIDGSMLIGTLVYDNSNDQRTMALSFNAPRKEQLDQVGLCNIDDFEKCTKINIEDYSDVRDESGSTTLSDLTVKFEYNTTYSTSFIINGILKGVKQVQLHNKLNGLKVENVQALFSGVIDFTLTCINSEIIGEVSTTSNAKLITDGKFSSSLTFPYIEVNFDETLDKINFEVGNNVTFYRTNANMIFLCFRDQGTFVCVSPSGKTALFMKRLGNVPNNFTLKGPTIEEFHFSGFEPTPLFLHTNFASYEVLKLFLADKSSVPFSFVEYKTVQITFEDENPECYIGEINLIQSSKTYTFINGVNTKVTIGKIAYAQNQNIMKFITGNMISPVIIENLILSNVKNNDINNPSLQSDGSIKIITATSTITDSPLNRHLTILQDNNEFSSKIGVCLPSNSASPTFCQDNIFEWEDSNQTINNDLSSILTLKLATSSTPSINDFIFLIKGQNKIINSIKIPSMLSTNLQNVESAFIGEITGNFNVVSSSVLGNAIPTLNTITLTTDGRKSSSIKFPKIIITFPNLISEVIFNENENITFEFEGTNDGLYYLYADENSILEIQTPDLQNKFTFVKNYEILPEKVKLITKNPINWYHFTRFINSSEFIEVKKDLTQSLYIELEDNSRCLFSYDDCADVTIKFIGESSIYTTKSAQILKDRKITYLDSVNTQIVFEEISIKSGNNLEFACGNTKFPIIIDSIIISNDSKTPKITADGYLSIGKIIYDKNTNTRPTERELQILSEQTVNTEICINSDYIKNCQMEKIERNVEYDSTLLLNQIQINFDLVDDNTKYSNFIINGKIESIKQLCVSKINSLLIEKIGTTIKGTVDFEVTTKSSCIFNNANTITTKTSSLISDGFFSCEIPFPLIKIDFNEILTQILFKNSSIISFSKGESEEVIYKFMDEGVFSISSKVNSQSKLMFKKDTNVFPKEMNLNINSITEFTFDSFLKSNQFIKVLIDQNKDYIINLQNGGDSPLSFDDFSSLTVNFVGSSAIYSKYELDSLSSKTEKKITFKGENIKISINNLLVNANNNININVLNTNNGLTIKKINIDENIVSILSLDNTIQVGVVDYTYNKSDVSLSITSNDLSNPSDVGFCIEIDKNECRAIELVDNQKLLNIDIKTSPIELNIKAEKSDSSSKSSFIISAPSVQLVQIQVQQLKEMVLSNIKANIEGKIIFPLTVSSSVLGGTATTSFDALLTTDLKKDVLIPFTNININAEMVISQQSFENENIIKYDSISVKHSNNSIIKFKPYADQTKLSSVKNGVIPNSYIIDSVTLNSFYFEKYLPEDEIWTIKLPYEQNLNIELNSGSTCPFSYQKYTKVEVKFSGSYETYNLPYVDTSITKTIYFTGVDTQIIINKIPYEEGHNISFNTGSFTKPIIIKELIIQKEASEKATLVTTGSFDINKVIFEEDSSANRKGSITITEENSLYDTFIGMCLLSDITKCPQKGPTNSVKVFKDNRKVLESPLSKLKFIYQTVNQNNETSIFVLDISGTDKIIRQIPISYSLDTLKLDKVTVDITGPISFPVELTNSAIQGDATTTETAKLTTDVVKSSTIAFPKIFINFVEVKDKITFDVNNIIKYSKNDQPSSMIEIKTFNNTEITIVPIETVTYLNIEKIDKLPKQLSILSDYVNSYHFKGFLENTDFLSINLSSSIKLNVELESNSICPFSYTNHHNVKISFIGQYDSYLIPEISTNIDKKFEFIGTSTVITVNKMLFAQSHTINLDVQGIYSPIIINELSLSKETIKADLITTGSLDIKKVTLIEKNPINGNKETKFTIKSEESFSFETYIGICLEKDAAKCSEKKENNQQLFSLRKAKETGEIPKNVTLLFEATDVNDNKINFELSLSGKDKALRQIQIDEIGKLKVEGITVEIAGEISFNIEALKSKLQGETASTTSSATLTIDGVTSSIIPFSSIAINNKFDIALLKFQDNSDNTKDPQILYSSNNKEYELRYKGEANISIIPSGDVKQTSINIYKIGTNFPNRINVDSQIINHFCFDGFSKDDEINDVITTTLNRDTKLIIELVKGCLSPIAYQDFKDVQFLFGTDYETFIIPEMKTTVYKQIEFLSQSSSVSTRVVIKSISYSVSNEISLKLSGFSNPILISELSLLDNSMEAKLITTESFDIETIKLLSVSPTNGVGKLGVSVQEGSQAFVGICLDTNIENCPKNEPTLLSSYELLSEKNLKETDITSDKKVLLEYSTSSVVSKLSIVGKNNRLRQIQMLNLNQLELENISANIFGVIDFEVILKNSDIKGAAKTSEKAKLISDCMRSSVVPFSNIELNSRHETKDIIFEEGTVLVLKQMEGDDEGQKFFSFSQNATIDIYPEKSQEIMILKRNENGNVPLRMNIQSQKIKEYYFHNFEKRKIFIYSKLHPKVELNLEDGYIPMMINFDDVIIKSSNPEKTIILPIVEVTNNQIIKFASKNPVLFDSIKLNDISKDLHIESSGLVNVDVVSINKDLSKESSRVENTETLSEFIVSSTQNDIKNFDLCVKDNFEDCEKIGSSDAISSYAKLNANEEIGEFKLRLLKNKEEKININMNGNKFIIKQIQIHPVDKIALIDCDTDLHNVDAQNIVLNFTKGQEKYDLNNYTLVGSTNLTFLNVKNLVFDTIFITKPHDMIIDIDKQSNLVVNQVNMKPSNDDNEEGEGGVENNGTLFTESKGRASIISSHPLKINNVFITSKGPHLRLTSEKIYLDNVNMLWNFGDQTPNLLFDFNGEFPKLNKSLIEKEKPLKKLVIEVNGNTNINEENVDDGKDIGEFVKNVVVPPDFISFPTLKLSKTSIIKLDLRIEELSIIGQYMITRRIDSIIIPSKYFYVFWFSILGILLLCFILFIIIIGVKRHLAVKNEGVELESTGLSARGNNETHATTTTTPDPQTIFVDISGVI